MVLDGIKLKGQRDIAKRIEDLDTVVDFDGKVVLDIGCNMGGVLHNISQRIKYGVGIDCSSKCINAANIICDLNHVDNLSFFTFDLDKDNIDDIDDFVLAPSIDIVFFMAVAHWIKKWRKVIDKISLISPLLIFESNGSKEEQLTQEEYIRKVYDSVSMINSESTDDKSQKNRKLFICDTPTYNT